MHEGKQIAKGDTIFLFPSENEGGPGLIATGVVTSAKAIAKIRGIARQTPRVSITIRRTALARRRLGRSDLKLFSEWNDGRPETELNFKFYRQATSGVLSQILLTRNFISGTDLPCGACGVSNASPCSSPRNCHQSDRGRWLECNIEE